MIQWQFCQHFYGCDEWAVYGDEFCPEHQEDPAFQIEAFNER